MKITGKFLLVVLIILVLFLLVIFAYNKIMLKAEEPLREPLGQIVDVDGHNMSVYTEGTGDKTIVFMSGGVTCSPILDFKSLYSLLKDEYRVVVIEKFGYGFSDVVDKERNISSILEDTRAALKAADISEKYLNCITEAVREYCSEIFETLRKYEYNSELMRLYVTGGGGCLIKNFGEYDDKRVTIIDDICATAKGYEQLAYMTLRKKVVND